MHQQQFWHLAALVCGDIDEARFRAQPMGRYLESRLAFARALRADCRGERADALAAYRAYLAFPLWRRLDDRCADVFAEWRARTLDGGQR
jgi:hypothetical protein